MNQIQAIIKRDGRRASFNIDKIADAIYKAAQVLGGNDREMALYLARQVELYLTEVKKKETPTVEEIQDAVEKNPD
jgi:ribonucleoside-triphosphate reductase class III catalytic subunit (EC 1.17.4.2)